jgi:hypothetical protein
MDLLQKLQAYVYEALVFTTSFILCTCFLSFFWGWGTVLIYSTFFSSLAACLRNFGRIPWITSIQRRVKKLILEHQWNEFVNALNFWEITLIFSVATLILRRAWKALFPSKKVLESEVNLERRLLDYLDWACMLAILPAAASHSAKHFWRVWAQIRSFASFASTWIRGVSRLLSTFGDHDMRPVLFLSSGVHMLDTTIEKKETELRDSEKRGVSPDAVLMAEAKKRGNMTDFGMEELDDDEKDTMNQWQSQRRTVIIVIIAGIMFSLLAAVVWYFSKSKSDSPAVVDPSPLVVKEEKKEIESVKKKEVLSVTLEARSLPFEYADRLVDDNEDRLLNDAQRDLRDDGYETYVDGSGVLRWRKRVHPRTGIRPSRRYHEAKNSVFPNHPLFTVKELSHAKDLIFEYATGPSVRLMKKKQKKLAKKVKQEEEEKKYDAPISATKSLEAMRPNDFIKYESKRTVPKFDVNKVTPSLFSTLTSDTKEKIHNGCLVHGKAMVMGHGLDSRKDVVVVYSNGKEEKFQSADGQVVKSDVVYFLPKQAIGLPSLQTEPAVVGMNIAIWFQNGTISMGRVLKIYPDGTFEHDCSTEVGDCASPVVNVATGRVIGLHQYGSDRCNGAVGFTASDCQKLRDPASIFPQFRE